MFNENEILARLQNGEDIQKIANEFADMLNQANKTYADQKAKEEEARKAEELKKAQELQKRADLQDILDQFTLWFAQYYGIKETLNADDIMVLIDEVQGAMKLLENLAQPVKKVAKTSNPDDVLNTFLKNMGW